ETLKSEIFKLLRDSGEAVNEEDSFTFTRLGEGRGFSSLLWNVTVGSRVYAVKVTDTVSRVEEIAKMVSLQEGQKGPENGSDSGSNRTLSILYTMPD
ncbi:hypothetical protein PENTCL1PPCAC_13577, partial [Pristionchus entomophagus]